MDGVPAFPAPAVSSWLMTTTLVGARRRLGIAFARSGPASEPTATEPATPAAPLRRSRRVIRPSSMGLDILYILSVAHLTHVPVTPKRGGAPVLLTLACLIC